ncbi:hypothetical protein SAMN05216593_10659 [Pseudomonas asturiensis]|uniref:Diadenosine tetraphosphate (Ap4A) hydrolase n=1 Tax=Pseudomonas asturiensis TaxID=1190415 RepID=A0A1M7NHZ6_9PSED|nr:hypothetical protein [Pseudomonas asturiensis]SHN03380.1 hypothetical protein SAMN05216593_10659 [Pseudomonas asturiensis]
MTEWDIFETAHWRISHRRDARYSGYLMVASVAPASDLGDLNEAALAELGGVLRSTEQLLMRGYEPWKVIVYKLGFSAGFNLHFHIAPVTKRLFAQVADHPGYAAEPDGNDVILFLSREYCEQALSAEERLIQAREVVRLRGMLN